MAGHGQFWDIEAQPDWRGPGAVTPPAAIDGCACMLCQRSAERAPLMTGICVACAQPVTILRSICVGCALLRDRDAGVIVGGS